MWLVGPVNRRVELRRKIVSMVGHSLQTKKGYNGSNALRRTAALAHNRVCTIKLCKYNNKTRLYPKPETKTIKTTPVAIKESRMHAAKQKESEPPKMWSRCRGGCFEFGARG